MIENSQYVCNGERALGPAENRTPDWENHWKSINNRLIIIHPRPCFQDIISPQTYYTGPAREGGWNRTPASGSGWTEPTYLLKMSIFSGSQRVIFLRPTHLAPTSSPFLGWKSIPQPNLLGFSPWRFSNSLKINQLFFVAVNEVFVGKGWVCECVWKTMRTHTRTRVGLLASLLWR